MPVAGTALVTQGTQLEKRVHLLLVGQHVGLQEPELEDLVGVDGGDGFDDVHHLGEVFLRKGGD